MSEFKQTFNSSLGKKLIMALTGLFLCTFLIVHLGGNLLLFKNDDGFAFNVYANFLTHFPPIEVVAYILYLSILVHAVVRPHSYHRKPQGAPGWVCRSGQVGCFMVVKKYGASRVDPVPVYRDPHERFLVPLQIQRRP